MIIAIDGPHETGKTTIINKLKERYREIKQVEFLKFPLNDPIGELLKNHETKWLDKPKSKGIYALPVAALLYCADYAVYTKNEYDNKKIYILDRYFLTLLAENALPNTTIFSIFQKSGIKFPDVEILIKKPTNTSAADIDYNEAIEHVKNKCKKLKIHEVVNYLSGRKDDHDMRGFLSVAKIIDKIIEDRLGIRIDRYQVFITFKNREIDGDNQYTDDVTIAEQLYEKLKKKNIKTYCFTKINGTNKNTESQALGEALVQVVILTRKEYLKSENIQQELNSFNGYDMKRKPRITCFHSKQGDFKDKNELHSTNAYLVNHGEDGDVFDLAENDLDSVVCSIEGFLHKQKG